MKSPFYLALAASLAFGQIAVSSASAEAAHFRSAPAQTFSQADLQSYGLSADQAARGVALQQQGYHVQVMTQDEAQRVYGGQMSTKTWIIIGVVALVVIAVAAASN
jgi:hypothetical protein